MRSPLTFGWCLVLTWSVSWNLGGNEVKEIMVAGKLFNNLGLGLCECTEIDFWFMAHTRMNNRK